MFYIYYALKIIKLFSLLVYFHVKENDGWHVYDRPRI